MMMVMMTDEEEWDNEVKRYQGRRENAPDVWRPGDDDQALGYIPTYPCT